MDPADLLDGDRLSQLLFDAGAADPFLARELADGVLHFLLREFEVGLPTSAEVVDATAKVVAQLGHPRLARAIPGVAGTLDEPAIETSVFPGLVAAALERGLIRFDDEGVPDRLAGGLVDLPAGEYGRPLFEALESARECYSQFIVIDRAETVAGGHAVEWTRSLALGLRLTGLRASLVLNRRDDQGDSFGLFSGDDQPTGAVRLLRELPAEPRIDLVIRVGHQDFAGPGRMELLETCEAVVDRPVTFALDRPRVVTGMIPEIASGSPALMTSMTLDLAALLDALHPRPTPTEFAKKLGSFARLALSAGHAWQRGLRRFARPPLQAGFLLERASLAIRPTRFGQVLDELLPDAGPIPRHEFVRSAWQQLRTTVAEDALSAVLTGNPGVEHPLDGATVTLPADPTAESLFARLESCYREGGASWISFNRRD